jgi:hypothetical protein
MDNKQPISFQPEDQEAPQISLDQEQNAVPSSPTIAESRAKKAAFALKSTSNVSYEDLQQALASGQEHALRQEVSATADVQKSVAHRQLIQGMADTMGGAISKDQATFAQGKEQMAAIVGQPAPTNPNSVLEEYYAGEYLKPMWDISDQFNKGSFMPQAMEQIPERVKAIRKVGESLIAWREMAQKIAQDTADKYRDESMAGWAWDQAKSLIPGRLENLLRGNTDRTSYFGGLRGDVLRSQLADIESEPDLEKRRIKLQATVDKIAQSSPDAAKIFAQVALGQSTSERMLNNAMTLLDLSVLPGPVAVKGFIRGAAKVVAEKVAEKAALSNATTEAVKDVVKSTAGSGPTVRSVVNQHFGERSMAIDYSIMQARKGYKAVANEPLRVGPRVGKYGDMDVDIIGRPTKGPNGEPYQKISFEDPENPQNMTSQHVPLAEIKETTVGRYPNEGMRNIQLKKIVDGINKLEQEKKDLQAWHADYMAGKGSLPEPSDYSTVDWSKVSDQELQKMLEGEHWSDIHINQDFSGDPEKRANAGRGDLGAAATVGVTEDIMKDLTHQAHPGQQALDPLPSYLKSDEVAFTNNPGNGGQEIANRVAEQSRAFGNNILNIAKNIMRVNRIPQLLTDPSKWNDAIKSAVEAVKQYTKDSYPGLTNSILNISNPRYHPITNTYHMDMIVGRDTGEYFNSRLAAERYAKVYGIASPEIDKDGLGWFIRVSKPLDETSSVIRDMLLKTADAVTPDSWANSFLGWLRTPEETLSFENRMQRKLATYNASSFLEYAKETARDIGKIGRKNWNEFERTLNAARKMPDPDDPTKLGYFFKDGGELDNFYQTSFQRLPTDVEKSAYFAYKRIVEYDRVLRSMGLYRNKIRVGVESHSLKSFAEDGSDRSSDFFDGVSKNVLPASDDTIVIMGRKGNVVYQGGANRIPPKLREKIEPQIKGGEQKVIEVHDPEKRPLKKFFNSDSRIRYVVTENAESKPISLADQVPRRGGGHWDYDYDHYIKQAKIVHDEATGFRWYEGDSTLMPMAIRRLGKDVVEKLNNVRELLRAGKEDEAKALAMSKEGLPDIPWETHKGWYAPTTGAHGEEIAPRLSLTEPLRVVPRDKMIHDMDTDLQARVEAEHGKGSFKDGTRQGSLARQAQIQYTGDRDSWDVYTLNDTGSRHNPIYKYEPAEMLDPITTMNRALSKIANSTFMDDYKIYSIEHWIQEARPWIKTHELDEVDKSPFHYFNNIEEHWKPGAPEEVKRQLMSNRMKIKQLIGTPSSTDNFLMSAQQAMVDSIYGKLGPKAVALTPDWLLPSLKDPFRFMRSVVFNMKMGLFSVPQLFVHAMTIVNAVGIAGAKVGFQGTFASLLHGWARINPSMIDHLDEMAAKMGIGWKPGEFKESMSLIHGPEKRTGFMDVAGEHAYLDTPFANKIFSNGTDKFLDAGQMFFRGGVTWLRSASWHMAYKEFRALNPTGRITDDNLQRILERADILSHNMTRASTSTVTKGVMSVPAQFYTYQLRLFELMTGTRLTGVEKARLFGANMLFFGIPAATGLGLYPFGNSIRNYAQQNGYVLGDNFVTSAMMQGIPSLVGALITGGADIQKGTFFNVGGRYGVEGVGAIEDVVDGDKTILDVLGGASYSTLHNIWGATSGFRTVVAQAWKGQGDYQLTVDDAVGPFKEISSFSQASKTLAAINFGNWTTKNGADLYPTSPAMAILQGLTGLSDQRATDVWRKSITLKQHREYDNQLYGLFQKEFTLGTQAAKNKDPEGAKVHIKNAFAYLNQFGYPPEKIGGAVSAAIKNNQSIIDRVDYNLLVKDPRSRDLDTYNKIQQIKQKQTGVQ